MEGKIILNFQNVITLQIILRNEIPRNKGLSKLQVPKIKKHIQNSGILRSSTLFRSLSDIL